MESSPPQEQQEEEGFDILDEEVPDDYKIPDKVESEEQKHFQDMAEEFS